MNAAVLKNLTEKCAMNIKITKASGETEKFAPEKLLRSLVRAGVDSQQAEEIVNKVIPRIKPQMSTRKIFRLAHRYLRKINRSSVFRYSLKEALYKLGPTGYPFEKYIGRLLEESGYKVTVGVLLEGKCVKHEVDVYAEGKREIILVECKYRNSTEGSHDVKTALYVHARFQDLRAAMEKKHRSMPITGWLVSNARFSNDAVRFAECSGLKIKSWGYPEKESLQKIIEKNKLYPITVISELHEEQIRNLMGQNIILMKDLAKMRPSSIAGILSVSDTKAMSYKQQAAELCGC